MFVDYTSTMCQRVIDYKKQSCLMHEHTHLSHYLFALGALVHYG